MIVVVVVVDVVDVVVVVVGCCCRRLDILDLIDVATQIKDDYYFTRNAILGVVLLQRRFAIDVGME